VPTALSVAPAVPVPEADAVDAVTVHAAIEEALGDAKELGISGAAVTPHVLSYIAAATGGESVTANLSLAENNAGVAAALAVALRP
jgi:pseudouridine-5'-phosphate glycosidase